MNAFSHFDGRISLRCFVIAIFYPTSSIFGTILQSPVFVDGSNPSVLALTRYVCISLRTLLVALST